MKRSLINLFVKPLVILSASSVTGLAFGVIPCYIFPFLGADPRKWCGYKSEPPHFLLQFWVGFILAALLVAYLAYREK